IIPSSVGFLLELGKELEELEKVAARTAFMGDIQANSNDGSETESDEFFVSVVEGAKKILIHTRTLKELAMSQASDESLIEGAKNSALVTFGIFFLQFFLIGAL